MSESFEAIREHLLRAGIAPRHVRRYLSELDAHLMDLVAEEKAAGHGDQEAARRAQGRLGSCQDLVAAMVCQRKLYALSARAPWAAFLVLPMTAYFAIESVLLFGLMIPAHKYIREPALFVTPDWLVAYGNLVVAFANFLLPVLAAVFTIALAISHRLRPRWPLVGLLSVIIFACSFTMGVKFPSPQDMHGTISMRTALPMPFLLNRMHFVRMFILSSLAVPTYIFFYRRIVVSRMPRSGN